MDKFQVHSMLVRSLIIALAFKDACATPKPSHLKFTMSPATIVTGLTRVVQLRCDVTESFEGTVEALKVTWRNATVHMTVAAVTKQSPVVTDTTNGDLTAEGSAQGRPYLALTWSQPSKIETGGEFLCKLVATKTGSFHHDEEITFKIKRRDPILSDVISALKGEHEEIVGLEQENSNITACITPRVAFHVRLPKIYNFDFKKNQVLKYTDVKINTEGIYDTTTGVFTAREAGIYKFNLHIFANNNANANLNIALNGQAYAATLAHGKDVKYSLYNSASTSAVVHLNVGDKISVVAGWDGTIWQWAGRGERNSFSGTLVQSDACLE